MRTSDSSFPSSAWERQAEKLRFASGPVGREAPLFSRSGASRRAFPSGAWERGRGGNQVSADDQRDKPREAWCSFCRKHHRDVGPLAEGPDGVYICYPCVKLCVDIL